MMFHLPVGGMFAVIGTAEMVRGIGLAVRRAVRVATFGTDDLPLVAILQRMVPAAVFRLCPIEAQGSCVREMSRRFGHV